MFADIPQLALGGNVFGWTADEVTSLRILDRFTEAGGVMIDTAAVYSNWVPGHVGGESEAIIRRWLRSNPGKRDRVIIATKVGYTEGLAPPSIRSSCDASLLRLGIDRIDLYYQHKDDASVPLADSLGAFDSLVREGKVGAIGLSNFETDRVAEALSCCRKEGLSRPVALQNWYNLVERTRYEESLQLFALSEGLHQFPYYGLASGFLTGKYRSAATKGDSPRADRAAAYLQSDLGLAVLAALDQIAEECAKPVSAVALAWLKAQPTIAAPIASASTAEQLDELLAVLDLHLTSDQLARLEYASRNMRGGSTTEA